MSVLSFGSTSRIAELVTPNKELEHLTLFNQEIPLLISIAPNE
jgi:hypothetical protein